MSSEAQPENAILVEVDGTGVAPETVHASSLLELAASFVRLVEANAADQTVPLALTGLEVIDKCAAVRIRVDSPEIARECTQLALRQIGGEDPPKGLGHHVTRARAAVAGLPNDYHAAVVLGSWKRAIELEPNRSRPPLSELLAIRAVPIRVGGKRPAVRFKSFLEDDFTLSTTEEIARKLGSLLYKPIEIVAHIQRAGDLRIDDGRLESFTPVSEGDPRPAWREWFKQVSGDWHG